MFLNEIPKKTLYPVGALMTRVLFKSNKTCELDGSDKYLANLCKKYI